MHPDPEHFVTIGPRTFIGSPFEPCPACRAAEGLGLLMVHANGYVKRCTQCLNEEHFELPPPPTPRVLYLDQFAVSCLAKALLPNSRERFTGDDPATQRGFWPRLFARLERLVKLGVLVCPPSSVHRTEALLDDRLAGSLHRVHLHFAGGAQFTHHESVKRDQLYLALCGWLDDQAPSTLGRDDVVSGGGAWRDRLEISVPWTIDADEIDAVRAARRAATPGLQAIVREWSQQQGRSFAERQDEQLRNFGPSFLPLAPLSDLRIVLDHALGERRIPAGARTAKVEEFLRGDGPMATPFARLACGLFAALGWQAERGQAAAVDRGMLNDFQAIATYAPYCDAMLIDRTCRRLLVDTPLSEQLPSGVQFFDVRTLDELDTWLEAVEAGASAQHLELVERVYGKGWLAPFISMLDGS